MDFSFSKSEMFSKAVRGLLGNINEPTAYGLELYIGEEGIEVS